MALSGWEVALLTILIMAVIVASISLFLSMRYRKTLDTNTITRGMNGIGGSSLTLQCPKGQVISFTNPNPTTTRGALICTGDATCDAFWNPTTGQTSSFFAGTSGGQPASIDVFASGSLFTDIASCEGKESCQWSIPVNSDSRLAGTCLPGCSGQIAFVGTYDCVAK